MRIKLTCPCGASAEFDDGVTTYPPNSQYERHTTQAGQLADYWRDRHAHHETDAGNKLKPPPPPVPSP